MLLDSNANELSDNEMPEILSILPTFKSKKVIELGAGIGRFTTVLAKQASHVTAVDFIEKFIQKNQESNSSYSNIDYVCGDVTRLELRKNEYDMVFSNWLLMYLDDDEVLDLAEKCLNSIKVGGYLFFRESCFHASGNIKEVPKSENPTQYRSPSTYINFIQSKVIEENGEQYGFELVFARPSRTYIEKKNNSNQVCFLFNKVKLVNFHGYKTIREFLDSKQYSVAGILKYEKIFGSGFISTGGRDSTEKFLKELNLQPNQRVLDVGCGIGGGNFLMARDYGAEVFGLDLSTNMVGIAWDRAQENQDLKVHFEIGDVTRHDYPNEYFDVIYSRDTILHIADKKSLFGQFKRWLRPGGRVFITDYTCGPKPWSDEFTAYVEQRGYELLTVEEYGNIFKELGFVNVRAEDKTDTFVYYLNYELEKIDKIKESFIQEYSQQEYDYLIQGWKEKLVRCSQGHQKWGLFYAEKKSN